jgi:hypothetical protein
VLSEPIAKVKFIEIASADFVCLAMTVLGSHCEYRAYGMKQSHFFKDFCNWLISKKLKSRGECD